MSTDKPTPNEFCQWCYDHGLRYSKAGPWPHAKDCPNNPDRSKPVIDWEAHWIECHWKLTKSIINQIESERQRDEYARQLAESEADSDSTLRGRMEYLAEMGFPYGCTWDEAIAACKKLREQLAEVTRERDALRQCFAEASHDAGPQLLP